jgi:hypothetical protein
MDALREDVEVLARHVADLEPRRHSDPFANDVYEAAWYWRDLGNWVLEKNTRTNFPARAREEFALLEQLKDKLVEKPAEEQKEYSPVFETAERILKVVENVEPPRDGHLGILRIIREQFDFLQTDYGFALLKEEPIGVRLSSGEVYLELQWAKKHNSSCSFGPESNPKKSYGIDDLLFMYGDQRYRTLPDELGLYTESDVERWFTFLASIFKQYGRDVLSNRPGIFTELAKAQAQRDQEYTQAMNRLYGNSPTR